jgi:hypothetical protein
MTKSLKRNAIISIIGIVVCSAVYLFTLGHFFLPLGANAKYGNEKIETWGYTTYPLVIRPKPANVSDTLQQALWKISRPGQACLLATADRLQSAAPNQDHTLQEVLEAIGYKFPSGCHASGGGDNSPGWRITHYPSMLRRIARDLHFRVTWREPVEPHEDQPPNNSLQRARHGVVVCNPCVPWAGSLSFIR